MNEPLTDDYLIQCERDARRFQGAWTGTSGTLAAHVIRLKKAYLEAREELALERAKRHEQRAAIDGGY